MHVLSIKHLVTAAVLFVAPSAMSQAYGRATITNWELHTANVVVNYSGCKSDAFLVSQARRTDTGAYVPGVNEAPSKRGACLITSITATLNGDTISVFPYRSLGTSQSQFLLTEPNGMGNVKQLGIISKKDYDNWGKKR